VISLTTGRIIAILFLLFLITIMFLRIRFDVRYKRKGEDDLFELQMTMLRGLVKFKTKIPMVEIESRLIKPMVKVKAEAEAGIPHPVTGKGAIIKIPLLRIFKDFPHYLKKGLQYFNRYKTVIKKVMRSIRFHYFSWTTQIGLGDPADTGIATGVVWALKGLFFPIINSSLGSMKTPPKLLVQPCFDSRCLWLDFRCIFDIRIGHIIIAGLNIARIRFIS